VSMLKNFFFSFTDADAPDKKLERFNPDKHFLNCLIFAAEAAACQWSNLPFGQTPALPQTLVHPKGLAKENDYFKLSGANVIKLFTAVSYDLS
jgi:hypothetical protein